MRENEDEVSGYHGKDVRLRRPWGYHAVVKASGKRT